MHSEHVRARHRPLEAPTTLTTKTDETETELRSLTVRCFPYPNYGVLYGFLYSHHAFLEDK